MWTWKRGLAALAFIALGITGTQAEPSGEAVGVKPQAAAQMSSATRTLVEGDDIFIGERIVTGKFGEVQIIFKDNTRLVVGPESALLIEDYLLREDGSAGKLAVNALNGTFRFITGNSAKDRYVINTPTGTIGVRGTIFELYIADLVYILMQEGTTVNCPADGSDCMILSGQCEYGIMGVSSTEVVGNTDGVEGDARDWIKEIFKYAQNQSPLYQQFKVSGSERCLRKPPDVQSPGSGSTSKTSEPEDEYDPCDCDDDYCCEYDL